MKDLILHTVKQFLDRNYLPGSPVILGCSGGPDSLALLHLIVECFQFFPIDLHVAHVDHSWREESAEEAKELSEHVKKLRLPFHLHVLEKGEAKNEVEARDLRFNFFLKLYQSLGSQGLLLGHQADDQAETVLKRVLEGAGLAALGGIRNASVFNEMQIWRPLLTIPKKEILKWLEKRELKAFDDPTNKETKYLRSRMRVQIVPALETAFGKSISNNLVRLGDLAQEMKEYLHRKNPLLHIEKKAHPQGVCIDFTPYYPLDCFELKVFLKYLLYEEGIQFSYRSLEKLQKLIEEKATKRVIDPFIVDKGHLILIK